MEGRFGSAAKESVEDSLPRDADATGELEATRGEAEMRIRGEAEGTAGETWEVGNFALAVGARGEFGRARLK